MLRQGINEQKHKLCKPAATIAMRCLAHDPTAALIAGRAEAACSVTMASTAFNSCFECFSQADKSAHRLQLRLADVADPRAVNDDVADRRLVHVRHDALLTSRICVSHHARCKCCERSSMWHPPQMTS